jgi:hypothetical protein
MTLPNFLVIGAAKAGTTTLYEHLRAHPEIFMPVPKELRFFAYSGEGDDYTFPVKTLQHYESFFASVSDEKAIGEAAPRYLRSGYAPHRIKEIIPHVRLIASLRNPIDRSFSSYMMTLRNKGVHSGTPYVEALEGSEDLRRGYYKHVKRYIDLFGRDQIRIILFDELVAEPLRTVQSLYAFLGVQPDFRPDVPRVSNPGGLPRWKSLHALLANKHVRRFSKALLPEALVDHGRAIRNSNLQKRRMSEQERELALGVFRDDILSTQDLIGRDLSAWLSG